MIPSVICAALFCYAGKSDDFKFNFTHVLLLAIVIVLCGILNQLATGYTKKPKAKKAKKD